MVSGVDANDLKDSIINFYKINPSKVLEKIDYLLASGISNTDIMSHVYILKNSLLRIHEAVEKAKNLTTDAPNFYILLSLLRCKQLPRKSYVPARQRVYVHSLLQVPVTSFPPTSSDLRPLWSTERRLIKRNFDFLTSKGFSIDDILSCMILLAHDPVSLSNYYSTMWSRQEVTTYKNSEAWQDKKRVLALLQYLIEKDMNFTSSVFHADVEYDQGSTAEAVVETFDLPVNKVQLPHESEDDEDVLNHSGVESDHRC